MDIKDLIAEPYRKSVLGCEICEHLMFEYQSGSDGKGTWICSRNPAYSRFKTFPFQNEMSCFELAFSFTVFAQDLPRNDVSYEAALGKFTESMLQLTRSAVVPGSDNSPGSEIGIKI